MHQRIHALLRGFRLAQIAVAQPGLIIQGGEKQRGHQPFLVPEVVINRAHAGVAFGADHFNGRGLDPLLVEQGEGLSKNIALEFSASSGVAALE
ncbi:hypothetical protein D3C76_1532130 [compost metagenome]